MRTKDRKVAPPMQTHDQTCLGNSSARQFILDDIAFLQVNFTENELLSK